MLPLSRHFMRERRGNFSTLTALAFPVLLLGAGLTLNTASLFLQKRHLQSVTDLAAITAAANLTKAQAAAAVTLSDNGVADLVAVDGTATTVAASAGTLRVELGRYAPDVAKSPDQRFQPGSTPVNAVRVTAQTKGDIYFPTPVLSDAVVGTSAVATIAPEAAFTVGSRTAKLEAGILNGVLGKLLGTTLDLSAADYESLLETELDTFSFLDRLASQRSITTGTYQTVLDGSASVSTLLKAAAEVPGLNLSARNVLGKIVNALPSSTRTLPLSKLMSLGRSASAPIGKHPSATPVKLGVLDLINAAAALSNGSNQVAVDTGLNLSPLANVKLDIAIGEPPQSSAYLTLGEVGRVVYTAQTRLRLVADVGTIRLSLLPLLPLTLLTVKVPLLLDLGNARGELTAVSCQGNDPDTASVSIATWPALAQMSIADVPTPSQIKDFSRLPTLRNATLIDVVGLKVTAGTGSGVVASISNVSDTTLTFDAQEIRNRTVKSASVRNYSQSLTASLLGSLSVNVEPLGLGLTAGPLIKPLLAGAVAPLDTVLLNVLTALGVKLGSADVWVNGVNCGRAVLVQ